MPKDNEKNTPETEIVYVLTNEGMPGLVKIGRTNNLPRRLGQHFRTSVPYPFVVNYAVEVAKDKQVENLLLELFRAERVPRREFVKLSPEKVIDALRFALRLIGGKVVDENHIVGDGKDSDDTPMDDGGDITEMVKAAQKQKAPRRPNFRFDELGIPIGVVLTFSGDVKVMAMVVDDKNTVEFEGKHMSVSRAANKVLGGATRVNGALYWEYEGETLDAIRTRKEQEAEDEDEDDS